MAKGHEEARSGRHEPLTWLQLAAEFSRTVHETLGGRVPDEFWQHARSARREELLALRTLLDARIARLEQEEQEATQRSATKISVQ